MGVSFNVTEPLIEKRSTKSEHLVIQPFEMTVRVELAESVDEATLSKAKQAAAIVLGKGKGDLVKKIEQAREASAPEKFKAQGFKKATKLIEAMNAFVDVQIGKMTRNIAKAVAMVTKQSPQSITSTNKASFAKFKVIASAYDQPEAETAESVDAELLDMLKKKGKWMYCGVAFMGKNLKVKLNHKKPLTKNELKDLKKEVGAAAKVLEGVGLIGVPMKFQFVQGMASPKQKVLKDGLERQSGKTCKVIIGEPLPEMPKKLSALK